MLASASLLIASGIASAAIVPVFSDGANDEFLVGDGIGVDGFTVSGDIANGGPSVALRARNRDDADPSMPSGGVYNVGSGLSQVQNPSQPQLQFEFQFSSGNMPADNYWLEIAVDFDPSSGTDFATYAAPIYSPVPTFSWNALDTNTCKSGTACTWGGDSGNSSFAVANSWNLGFGFWSSINAAAANYNPSAEGLYDIIFSAYEYSDANVNISNLTDPTDIFLALRQGRGSVVESASIQANVASQVSTPGIIALFGVSIAGLIFARRK